MCIGHYYLLFVFTKNRPYFSQKFLKLSLYILTHSHSLSLSYSHAHSHFLSHHPNHHSNHHHDRGNTIVRPPTFFHFLHRRNETDLRFLYGGNETKFCFPPSEMDFCSLHGGKEDLFPSLSFVSSVKETKKQFYTMPWWRKKFKRLTTFCWWLSTAVRWCWWFAVVVCGGGGARV